MNKPIRIEIAVVGDDNVDKSSLIKFWLSLGYNSIKNSDVYSKFFWLDNEPLQINIYKISNQNYENIFLQSKIYGAIVYVHCNSFMESMTEWFCKTKKYISEHTYQCIIMLSLLDADEEFYNGFTLKFFDYDSIDYYMITPKSESNISVILNKITIHAYKNVVKLYNMRSHYQLESSSISPLNDTSSGLITGSNIISEQNNYHLHKSIKLNTDSHRIYKKKTRTNLKCIEDQYVPIDHYKIKKENDNCIIV